MSRVELSGITRRYVRGAPAAIDSVDLTVDDGEFLVILGPSGCGKTTLLRCVAGLETPDEGRIGIGDAVVFDSSRALAVAPYKRDIGMVFQNYSLWPHMTIAKNVAYPLASRRVPRDEQADKTRRALELVECGELGDRLPAALSGGQQQRVALARAVVAEPRLMLFDEPLSNLDYRLRVQLREEIRQIHRRLGFTAIYVTHDQTEALQLGTRVVVMRSGVVEQIGTPEEVFSRPANPYVADFLGIKNRVDLRVRQGSWTIGPDQLPLDSPPAPQPDGDYELFVRGSAISLASDTEGRPGGPNAIRVGQTRVVDVLYGGEVSEWVVEFAGVRMRATAPAHSWKYRPGDVVELGIAAGAGLLYGDGERLVWPPVAA